MYKIALLFILFKITFIHAEEVQTKNWQHRVYLASYPRSGNHWLRYLIEEAKGIATSSVYQDPDPPHLDQVFPWGTFVWR